MDEITKKKLYTIAIWSNILIFIIIILMCLPIGAGEIMAMGFIGLINTLIINSQQKKDEEQHTLPIESEQPLIQTPQSAVQTQPNRRKKIKARQRPASKKNTTPLVIEKKKFILNGD